MKNSSIDRSLISSLSDAQIYHLDRIRQLNDETSNEVNYITDQIKGSVYDSLATVKAARASLDESILQQIRKDIDLQNYELENIRKAMEKQIYDDIQKQWLNMQEAGLPLQLSEVEQQYYDAYSPAQAFYLTNIEKFDQRDQRQIEALLSAQIDTSNDVDATIGNDSDTVSSIEAPIIQDDPIPPIIRDDEKICYTYLTGPDGKITSIPIAVGRNQSCEVLGMHSTPYVEPIPDNKIQIPIQQTTINPDYKYFVSGDTKWKYSSKDVQNCQNIGGVVRIAPFTDGKDYAACFIYDSPAASPSPFPPNELPTGGYGGVECGTATTIWDYLSKSDKSKEPSPVQCPPGCISIDSFKSTGETFKSTCSTWDNIPEVCNRVIIKSSENKVYETVSKSIAEGFIDGVTDIAEFIWDVSPPGVVYNFFMGNDSAASNNGSSSFGFIGDAIENIFKRGLVSIGKVIKSHLVGCIENPENIITSLAVQAASGWASTMSMCDVSYHFTSYVYEGKFQNPQLLPSQADFDSMYLADEITDEQWECYTKALGNLPNTHRKARDLKRNRVGPRELIMLNRYGKLDDSKYALLMRDLGIIYDGDKTRFEQSQVSLPGLPDILRFMVRDADNESVVERYKLDEGFSDSYKDKLKLWAKTQGVEEETAKYFWRAHWEYPSPTALYEMLKRLRPGTVPKEIEVTKQDALDLLKIADIAPYWREKLLAVSYNVPTRTDVKKGYNIDAIPEDKLVDMLQDNGYTEDDAKVIKDIYKSEKEIYKQNLYSRWSAFTPKSIAKMYGEGSLTRDEATEQLERMNFKPEAIISILISGQLSAKQKARKQCIEGNRRLYMIGELRDDQVKNALMSQGVDAESADIIFREWECKKLSSSKVVPATKNIKWYVLGIIDKDALQSRLENLLYKNEDVSRLMMEAEYQRNSYIRGQLRKAEMERRSDIRWQQQQEDRAEAELEEMIPPAPQSKASG